MRVAYVCADPGVPVFGRKGASVHVQEIIRVLLRRGAEVHLLAARTGGSPPPGLEQVDVHLLPGTAGESSEEREASARRAGGATGPLDRLGPLDLVYERYSLWGRAAMEWARQAGVPAVLEVNAPLVEEQARHRTLHNREAAEQVARTAVSAASTVVAVSAPVAGWVQAVVPGKRVHVVPNGVDTGRIQPNPAARGTAGSTCTIGFVGTLKPWHGVETLCSAFVDLAKDDPAYRMLVVGDGPQAPSLSRSLAAAGVGDRAELTGAVDPTEVPGLLRRMDIATAPYPASAGYFSPLKLYEYLAAGLPVVAGRVGQVPEIISDGRTGLLCSPGDPAALAAAVRRLREDPRLAADLGRRGREAAEARHTWEAVVDRILRAAEADFAIPALGA